jgi:hypothetical protein
MRRYFHCSYLVRVSIVATRDHKWQDQKRILLSDGLLRGVCIGITCRSHLRESSSVPLKMDPIGSLETSVSNHCTPCKNPGDGKFQLRWKKHIRWLTVLGPSMSGHLTTMLIMLHVLHMCTTPVLIHRNESGGRTAGRKGNYYNYCYNLLQHMPFTSVHLFMSFVKKHMLIQTIASYISPRQDT